MTPVPHRPDLLDLLDDPSCRIAAASGRVLACNEPARRLGLAVGRMFVAAFEAGAGLPEVVRLLADSAPGEESWHQVVLGSGSGPARGLSWSGRIAVRLVAAGGGEVFAQLRTLPETVDHGASVRRLRHSLEVLDRLAKRVPGAAVPSERMAVWLAAAVGIDDCVVVDRLGAGPFTISSVTSPRFRSVCEAVLDDWPAGEAQTGAGLAARIAAHHPAHQSAHQTAHQTAVPAGRFVRVGRVPGGIRGAVLLGGAGGGESEVPRDERDRVLRIAARLLETRAAADEPRTGRPLAVVLAADAGTRAVLRGALELRGHPVVDASDAGTARTLVATDPAVGLLVLAREASVALPLAEEVAALRPTVAVVWCTAAGEHRQVRSVARDQGRITVLEMPFLPDELDRVLRRSEAPLLEAPSLEGRVGEANGDEARDVSAPRAPD